METNTPITIVQGASWEEVKFWHPEDLSSGTVRGQIRSDTLDRAGELFAEFDFYPLVYGAVTLSNSTTAVDRTLIAPRLSGAATSKIPLTRAAWVYDIFVRIGTRSIKIGGGTVTVVPRVTEG